MTARPRKMASAAVIVLGVLCSAAPAALGQTKRQPGPKEQFATSLAQFVEAIAGVYGDEGALARSSLEEMRRALARWDASVAAYEAAVAAEIPGASPSRAAGMHLDLGLVYLDRGRIEEATRELTAAVELDPTRADVFFLLGMTEGQRNRPEEAVRALRQSARLDPTKHFTFYLLASQLAQIGALQEAERARQAFVAGRTRTLTQPLPDTSIPPPFIDWGLFQQRPDATPVFAPARYAKGFALLSKGQYSEAIPPLEEAVATDRLAAGRMAAGSERFARGTAALRQGRLSDALEHLQAAIRSTPEDGEAHRILGTAYWASGQHVESLEQFERAIRLNPDDERARMALADALVALRRFEDGKRVLEEAIRAVPDSGQAHYRLGQLRTTLDGPSEARRAFEEAARLGPLAGLDHVYRTIGDLLAIERDFEAVLSVNARRVALNPNNADAHVAFSQACLQLHRSSEAQAELLVALMIDPRHEDAYDELAQAYVHVGDYVNAQLAARRAVALDPASIDARYTLATSLVRLGRMDEGKRELERYRQMRAEAEIERRREFEVTALLRAVTQSMGRGDYEDAAARLRDAIGLKPGDPALHVSLGLVLGNAGRLPDAIEAFERALKLGADLEVHRHLFNAYTALGRPGDAQRHRELYEKPRTEGPSR